MVKFISKVKSMIKIHNEYEKIKRKFHFYQRVYSSVRKKYPKWLIEKWLLLYNHFKKKEFGLERAKSILNIKGCRSVLSIMKKRHMVFTRKSKNDSRKTFYKLAYKLAK